MADPDPSVRRVLLVGPAEPSLVEATHDVFVSVGCTVSILPDHDGAAVADRPDVCVCFARTPLTGPLVEMDDGEWERQLGRHLMGPRRTVLAAARSMGASGGGAIVIAGSVDAYHAYPGRSVAATVMGALLGLVRSMAVELSASAVRTNMVVAGPLGSEDGGPPPGATPRLAERTLLRSPVHRFARPSEVAAAIRFVAGPEAAFMTGQSLRVDGGWASLNQAPEGMRFP